MLAVPPAILDMLQLESGAAVDMAVEGGRLILQPSPKKYTLQELLDQCDPSAPISGEDSLWTSSSPKGQELL
jgi:antitoxin ChpS